MKDYLSWIEFCPRCGGGMEFEARDEQAIPVCGQKECRFEYWPAMHPAVSVIVQDDMGRVLMTRRAMEPEKGKLDIPGGFVQYGELPEVAAVREFKEEVGADIEVTGLLGMAVDEYLYQGQMQLNLAIGVTARLVGNKVIVPNAHEIEEVLWLRVGEIDFGELAFRCDGVFLKALGKIK